MASQRTTRSKQIKSSSLLLLLALVISAITFLSLFSSLLSSYGSSSSSSNALQIMLKRRHHRSGHDKYLYWGRRIDCPGKHCDSCEGLGHQESSLRCALEEALYLRRIFVMPSRMCINPLHNKKGILHQSGEASSEEM